MHRRTSPSVTSCGSATFLDGDARLGELTGGEVEGRVGDLVEVGLGEPGHEDVARLEVTPAELAGGLDLGREGVARLVADAAEDHERSITRSGDAGNEKAARWGGSSVGCGSDQAFLPRAAVADFTRSFLRLMEEVRRERFWTLLDC